MGLAETQKILAQLYTNTPLRERFFANPNVVGLELGLNLKEIQNLAQVSSQDVHIFANSLKWKRLGEIRELLPQSVQVLGKDFNTLFWQYSETYLPQGIKKHRYDAIAFADFILKTAQVDNLQLQPPWIYDLLRYEKAWLLAYDSHFHWQISWFHYTIHLDCQRQPTMAIWWRLSQKSPLQHFLIVLPPWISKLNHSLG